MDKKTQPMDKNRKMAFALDIVFVVIITVAVTGFAMQVLENTETPEMIRMFLVGIGGSIIFIMGYSTYVRHTKTIEEAYDRYCTQIVNGKMTEFPTIFKQECFRSIEKAENWWLKSKGLNQSYRIVDLADGSIVIINGVKQEKRATTKPTPTRVGYPY